MNGEKWRYIPKDFIINRPAGAPKGVPFYWDISVPETDTLAAAFIASSEAELIKVLRWFKLKNATWMDHGQYLVCTEAIPFTRQTPENLLKAYSRAREGIAEEIKLQLKSLTGSAQERLAALTNTYREIERLTCELERIRNGTSAEQELARIRELDKVDRLWMMNDGILAVKTKPLAAAATGVIFGRYTIQIDPNSGSICHIRNDKPVEEDYYHHPHIFGSGSSQNICWGNVGGNVAELRAKRDIPGLIALTIDFIESFNPENVSRDSYRVYYEYFAARERGDKNE